LALLARLALTGLARILDGVHKKVEDQFFIACHSDCSALPITSGQLVAARLCSFGVLICPKLDAPLAYRAMSFEEAKAAAREQADCGSNLKCA
jgi:hypothetical protein